MRKGLVTTNEQKPTGQGEPQKLNIITSNVPNKEVEEKGGPKGVIPFAVLQPEPKGTDLSKMITTHDIGDEVILREVDKVEVEVGKAIDLGAAGSEPAPAGDEDRQPVLRPPSHKKAGRPKK